MCKHQPSSDPPSLPDPFPPSFPQPLHILAIIHLSITAAFTHPLTDSLVTGPFIFIISLLPILDTCHSLFLVLVEADDLDLPK